MTRRGPAARGINITLEGKQVKINDHVFVSASYADRGGEPYHIARVLEFLPASPPSQPSDQAPEPRVRVAYYLRPRDISTRYFADFRLLFASMHTDVMPVSYIRGPVTVMHKDHIKDLAAYRRTRDSFYFSQLYDRYLHRYFDIVPINKVQNAPVTILAHLTRNYEFIICETSYTSELCNAQRACDVCHTWAPHPDSVVCARCARVFHLGCVDPPLLQKPRAGYAWSCAPCSKAHEDEVETYVETGISVAAKAKKGGASSEMVAPKQSLAVVPVDKGRTRAPKTVSPTGPNTDSRKWRTMNHWPFRYYGMHTQPETVLDPHDSVYPKAKTRMGPRFQAVVPDWDHKLNKQETLTGEPVRGPKGRVRAGTPSARADPFRVKKKGVLVPEPVRGEEDGLRVISKPKLVSETIMDQTVAAVKELPLFTQTGVDSIDRALTLLMEKDGDKDAVLDKMKTFTQAQLGHVAWTEADKRKLANALALHGTDLEEAAKGITGKKTKDVVKRFYIHLGHLKQEDGPQQPEEKAAAAAAAAAANASATATMAAAASAAATAPADAPTVPAPTLETGKKKGAAKKGAPKTKGTGKTAKGKGKEKEKEPEPEPEPEPEVAEESDAEGSVYEAMPGDTRLRSCAICMTDDSIVWYSCPARIVEAAIKPSPCVMCEVCGIRWRHYALQYPPHTDDPKNVAVIRLGDGTILDEPAEDSRSRDRSAMRQVESTEPVPETGGLPDVSVKPCVLCKRYEPKEELAQCRQCTLSVHVACYGILEDVKTFERWLCDLCAALKRRQPLVMYPHCVLCPNKPAKSYDAPLTALDCLKPTEMQNYVHLICAVWHPELKLSDPTELRFIEGLPNLPSRRKRATCTICNENVGACMRCEGCPKLFHVACAWTAGYKFAFEVRSVKKKKNLEAIRFKDSEGDMAPCIWCPDHQATPTDNVTVDLGYRDVKTKQTALQAYVQANKNPKPLDSYPLLRQARRLDALTAPALVPETLVSKGKKRPRQSAPPKTTTPRPSQPSTPVEASPAKKRRKRQSEPAPVVVPKAKPVPEPTRRSGRVPRPITWASDMFVTSLSDDFDDTNAAGQDAEAPGVGQDQPAEPTSLGPTLQTFEISTLAGPSNSRPQRQRRPPHHADSPPSLQPPSPTRRHRLDLSSAEELPPLPQEPIKAVDIASPESKSVAEPDGNMDLDKAVSMDVDERGAASASQDDVQPAVGTSNGQGLVVKLVRNTFRGKGPSSAPAVEAAHAVAPGITAQSEEEEADMVTSSGRRARKARNSSFLYDDLGGADQQPADKDWLEDPDSPAPPPPTKGEPRPRKKRASNSSSARVSNVTCANCGTTSSPMFRRGPDGNHLCNACGLYIASHGVPRPIEFSMRPPGSHKFGRQTNQRPPNLPASGYSDFSNMVMAAIAKATAAAQASNGRESSRQASVAGLGADMGSGPPPEDESARSEHQLNGTKEGGAASPSPSVSLSAYLVEQDGLSSPEKSRFDDGIAPRGGLSLASVRLPELPSLEDQPREGPSTDIQADDAMIDPAVSGTADGHSS